MRALEYCRCPPLLDEGVMVTQHDQGRYIIGNDAVGHYLLLGSTEHQVLRLIDGSRDTRAVREDFNRRSSAPLSVMTLIGFLRSLDDAGLLAGVRASGRCRRDLTDPHLYVRFPLFNPEALLTRFVGRLRWLWQREVAVAGLVLMAGALVLGLTAASQIDQYTRYVMREYFFGVVLASVVVLVSHEFAHGLTCHAFGGRVTEMGVLLIYYLFPGFYCNVSSVHRLANRSHRVWVIAAGVYWQALVAALSLFAWSLSAPYAWLADLFFVVFLGSVLNLVFNANPLVKLDGYYALSQWLGLPNLMDRSRAFWRLQCQGLIGRPAPTTPPAWSARERRVYAVFGLLAGCYSACLLAFVVYVIGRFLVTRLHFVGFLVTVAIALIVARGPIGAALNAVACGFLVVLRKHRRVATEPAHREGEMSTATSTYSRPRIVIGLAVSVTTVLLLLPWTASLGEYGTLTVEPQRQAVIRAPEDATLMEVFVRPGEYIASGKLVARFQSLELEEEIADVEAQLARTVTEFLALEGQLSTGRETAARARVELEGHSEEFAELQQEQQHIARRSSAERLTSLGEQRRLLASLVRTSHLGGDLPSEYPAAIAAIEAEVEATRIQLAESTGRAERARQLSAAGLLARAELLAAETHASSLTMELQVGRERLAAALVDHRRRHAKVRTYVLGAESDLRGELSRLEALGTSLITMRKLRDELERRREILLQKRAALNLSTTAAGTVLGNDLLRLVGSYLPKGTEICRVADGSQLLLRIPISERQLGDLRAGNQVRVRTPMHPQRTHTAVVSRLSDEADRDPDGRVTVQVELLVDNRDGDLRSGMTAFARVDFDRWTVGRILFHKLRQALRQEIWML